MRYQNVWSVGYTVQEHLNTIWNVIFELPVYRDLKVDMNTSYNLFLNLLSEQNNRNVGALF